MRERPHQSPAPAVVKPAERSLELSQRLAALRRRLRRHQIGDGLRRRQIELAVLEGAARELSRLGKAQSRHGKERRGRRFQHGAAAMEVELRHILAGGAGRRRKEEREPVIDGFARARVAKARPARAPRRRHGAGERTKRLAGGRARHADDREGGSPWRRRRREDRIGQPCLAHDRARRLNFAAPPHIARAPLFSS